MKEQGVKFARIDSDLSDALKTDEVASESDTKNLEEIFKKALSNEKLNFKTENLKDEEIPAIILLSEEARRMQNMKSMFQGMDMADMFKDEETLVINLKNKLVQSILHLSSEEKIKDIELICQHIYDLARISSKQLEPEDLAKFITRSNKILNLVIEK